MFEPKDFGDLLEDPLDSLAAQVRPENVRRGVLPTVEQVGHHNHVLLTRPLERDQPHRAGTRLGMLDANDAPLLTPASTLCIAAPTGRAGRIGHEGHVHAIPQS